MPKARQSCAIGSPSRSCATNRRRSSITEHSFHGIHTSRFWEKAEGVTHVSGTNCHPCLGPLKASVYRVLDGAAARRRKGGSNGAFRIGSSPQSCSLGSKAKSS